MSNLYKTFLNPPNEFTQLPWWFWNNEITEEGIKKQLADFRQQGIFGFTIHARMGLSKDIPYLGKRWFELVKFAVQEAARNDMIVHLYDEGMYPSGSAHGQVVEGHPEFLARGLEMRQIKASEKLELKDQEKLVAILPEGQNQATATSEIPESMMYSAFVITLSNGVIRGVHEGEEDSQPDAPKAADLLNPVAMRRFIQLTHERYYHELKEYFGTTVQAFFTDEPSIMGRRSKSGLRHWTEGLEKQFQKEKGYDLIPFLPALWNDIGEKTASIRRDYGDVVANRLNESFYGQISEWCADHNVALTGHPAESDDIGPLRYFQLPGQDMVWRYVEPEKPTALEGKHSTVGKCSSSSARHRKARRNGNEVYGAYGWKLTMDEMKWLADWLMVRGVNLLWPHAFYYSIRGSRAYERPPDLGRHNLWWKHFKLLANYTKRICWLLTDSQQICDIAILAHHNHLPWEPAKVLFQNQWDFNYLEDRLLTDADIENGKLKLGDASYSVVVRMPDHHLPEEAETILRNFLQSGGRIIPFADNNQSFIQELGKYLVPDVVLNPPNSDLRYTHVIKDGTGLYYLTNEGANPIDGKLTIHSRGHAQWWDPLTGKSSSAFILKADHNSETISLHLERREGLILAINPESEPILSKDWETSGIIQKLDISTGWKLRDPEKGLVLGEDVRNWTEIEGYRKFSGTLIYEKTINITQETLDKGKWTLDLGEVHDFAEVSCNSQSCGVRLWGPFRFELPLKIGANIIQVAVTNSLANQMEDLALPSGMDLRRTSNE